MIRCIGIHSDESHRGKIPDTKGYRYWRPLVEFGINQDHCVKIIEQHGMQAPGKSSCWHCPAKKKKEVIELARDYPDLFARAVAMEHNARDAGGLKIIKGLGRNWSWEELVASKSMPMFSETQDMPCIWCDDGECSTNGEESGK